MGRDLKLFATQGDASKMCAILAAADVAGVRTLVGVVNSKDAEYRQNVHPTGVSPALQASCGRYVAGSHAVLTYLADQGDDSFRGRTSYERAQVASFLQLAHEQLATLVAGKADATLKELNAWFETRTFIASERLTVADIACAFALLPIYKAHANLAPFVDLNRWMDTVLNNAKVVKHASGDYTLPVDKSEKKNEKKEGGDKKDKKAKDKKKDEKEAPAWKKEADAKKKKGAPAAELNGGVFDLRVGTIKAVKKHETAAKLYVEQIDVGEKECREICSGLVEHMSADEILGKQVIVMCNLKPAKLVGTMSYGMVMCSTSAEGVVHLCKVPEGCNAGDKIVMEKYDVAEKVEQV